MKRLFSSLLFSSSFRIYVLRLLLLVAPFNVWFAAELVDRFDYLVVALCLQILLFVHHFTSIFVISFIHHITDVILTTAELGMTIVMTVYFGDIIPGPIQAFFLLLLLLTRFATLIRLGKDQLSKPFILCASCANGQRFSPWAILFGRRMWYKQSLRGESTAVKAIRSVSAFVLALTLLIFAGYSIIFLPAIDGINGTSMKLLSDADIRSEFNHQLNTMKVSYASAGVRQWNTANFNNGIQVSRRCAMYSDSDQGNGDGQVVWQTTNCTSVYDPSYSEPFFVCSQCSLQTDFSETFLSVDFSSAISLLFPSESDTLRVIVQIGDSQSPSSGEQSTTFGNSVTLRPGKNLEGFTSSTVRQSLTSSILNYIGGGDSKLTAYLVGSIDQVVPDTTITPSANVSTLRIFENHGVTMDTVYQEYQDKSVLSGLATAGGLFSFVNGAFLVIFGGGFLYFYFGFKELSRFGLIHRFQRRRIQEAMQDMYPRLSSEGGQPGDSNAGVVAFVREYLLNVDRGSSGQDEEVDLERQPHNYKSPSEKDLLERNASDYSLQPLGYSQ